MRTVRGPNGPAALPRLPPHLLLVRDPGGMPRGQDEVWGTGTGQRPGISSRVRLEAQAESWG